MTNLITNRIAGAFYNADDLNRVSQAAQYIGGRLRENGYIAEIFAKTDWRREDFPTAENMRVYLQNIQNIVAAYCIKPQTPPLPKSMERLDFTGANAIEQNIADVDLLIESMIAEFTAFKKSGEIVCGNYDLMIAPTVFIMRGFNKSGQAASQLDAIGVTWEAIEKGAWL